MAYSRGPKAQHTPRFQRTLTALAVLALPSLSHAQQAETPPEASGSGIVLEAIQVTGNWLGSGLQNSVKSFPGARTVIKKDEIEATGATSIDEVMRRIPGVQATENSGTAGSLISLNIGVRGLTGRYTPRSTVLLDGVPLAVAPYGQPQLSFAPISLNNIESIDVVRSGGAVRYGPQNVGGVINFKTRSVPTTSDLSGDVTVRHTEYAEGGGDNTQYSAFLGTQLESGLGLALLYSGMTGTDWRASSDDRFDDLALKARYDLTASSELYGKVAYYNAKSRTPGGLTVEQYNADPFQNTRPNDYWSGDRKSLELGYVNAISAAQEFEVRTYYTDSSRESSLINGAQVTFQPRNYTVLGIEPRYTQRVAFGPSTHDVTVGYRYIRERGDDNSYSRTTATGVVGTTTSFDNATDAHAVYVDDRIAIGAWRITPGVRFEHIESTRDNIAVEQRYETRNNKALPSISVAYLLTPALTVFTNYTTSFGPVQNLQLNSQTQENPLKPEVAKTAELGARWADERLKAEFTLFQIRFDNQIQQVPATVPTPNNTPVFANVGATKHDGVETAVDYSFSKAGPLAGLNVFANYSYTRAIQKSGANAGLDLPFYSRNVDTVGARYLLGAWAFNVNSTHQTGQFSDNGNTQAETEDAGVGRIPGFRLWNAQVGWRMPGTKSVDVLVGVNNIADERYYTRNVDNNRGRMVGPPRTAYVQGRLAF
jgi:Fe(3+) dicitrate transport protein